MDTYKCQYCGKICKSKMGLVKHEQYCLENPNALDRTIFKKIGIKGNKSENRKKPVINEYECQCLKCGKKYIVHCTEKEYNNGRYSKYCSINCANSHQHSEETKQKISRTIINKCKLSDPKCSVDDNIDAIIHYQQQIIRFCKECGNPYIGTGKYCSNCRQKKLSDAGKYSAKIQSEIRRSKNEIAFYELCREYFENVEHNVPLFNGWDADILIHDIKYAILWNGKWHYEKITQAHSVKQVQNRDKIKIAEIEKTGWIPYIIKDLGKYNIVFVKEQFDKFIKLIKN